MYLCLYNDYTCKSQDILYSCVLKNVLLVHMSNYMYMCLSWHILATNVGCCVIDIKVSWFLFPYFFTLHFNFKSSSQYYLLKLWINSIVMMACSSEPYKWCVSAKHTLTWKLLKRSGFMQGMMAWWSNDPHVYVHNGFKLFMNI